MSRYSLKNTLGIQGRGNGQCHREELHGLVWMNMKGQALKLSVISAPLLIIATKCESVAVVSNVVAGSEKVSGKKKVST